MASLGMVLACASPAQNPPDRAKSPAAPAVVGPLDLVPADAVAAIALRAPDDLRTKADKLVKDAEFDFGMRPTEALDQLVNWLGIRQGLDLNGPFALSFVRGADEDKDAEITNLVEHFIFAIPVKDRDQMAANFGIAKGALTEGKVLPAEGAQDLIKFLGLRGRHVLLANREPVLKKAMQASSLAGRLSAAQRAAFGAADILIHFNPPQAKHEWQALRNSLDKELARWQEPQDKETVEQFLATLYHVQVALIGVRVDQGLRLQFLATMDDTVADVKKFLGSLRTGDAARLDGLPDGRLVAAQAYSGAGERTGLFARAVVHVLLKDLLEIRRMTSATDRPTFLGVFAEVWQRLTGSRVGIYLTRDESRLGLFSLIAILDTADPGQFLADLRSLAKMADGALDMSKPDDRREVDIDKLIADLGDKRYAVRAAATTKLRLLGESVVSDLEKVVAANKDPEQVQRAKSLITDITAAAAERRNELLRTDLPRHVHPTFAWVAAAETRLGRPVDIVHIKLTDADRPATQAMRQYFGPDWDRMRLAVHGRQVVVLLGSEVALFEQALKNVQDGRKGIAEGLAIGPAAPVARFQVSADALTRLVNGQPLRPPGRRLTSAVLSIPESGLQVEVDIPTEELRALANARAP
jgi:hypothetical protein